MKKSKQETSIYEDDFLEEDEEAIEVLKEEIKKEESNNPYYTTTEGFKYDSEGLYASYYDTEYYLKIYREDFRINQPKYCFTWGIFLKVNLNSYLKSIQMEKHQ